MTRPKNIAIIGSGIAGLAAAGHLTAADANVTIHEAADHPGGRAGSHALHHNEHTWEFDTGAEFIGSFYTATHQLIAAAGHTQLATVDIDSTLIRQQRPYRLPASPSAILHTPLLSPGSKGRALALGAALTFRRRPTWSHLAASGDLDDQTAAAYFASRVGDDYANTVLRATLDSLALSPAQDTSRVIAMAQLRHAARSRLTCPIGGIGAVTDTLARRFDVRYGQHITNLDTIDADAIILAVPPSQARQLLEPDHPDHRLAQDARYNVAVKLHAALPQPVPGLKPTCPTGTGDHHLAGVNPLTAKKTRQAPPGHEGLEICAAPWFGLQLLDEPDNVVAQRLWDAAVDLLPTALPEPLAWEVVRLPEGVPLFYPGWIRRLRDRRLHHRIVAAGDWLGSPSLEGAVRSGQAAARAVLS